LLSVGERSGSSLPWAFARTWRRNRPAWNTSPIQTSRPPSALRPCRWSRRWTRSLRPVRRRTRSCTRPPRSYRRTRGACDADPLDRRLSGTISRTGLERKSNVVNGWKKAFMSAAVAHPEDRPWRWSTDWCLLRCTGLWWCRRPPALSSCIFRHVRPDVRASRRSCWTTATEITVVRTRNDNRKRPIAIFTRSNTTSNLLYETYESNATDRVKQNARSCLQRGGKKNKRRHSRWTGSNLCRNFWISAPLLPIFSRCPSRKRCPSSTSFGGRRTGWFVFVSLAGERRQANREIVADVGVRTKRIRRRGNGCKRGKPTAR